MAVCTFLIGIALGFIPTIVGWKGVLCVNDYTAADNTFLSTPCDVQVNNAVLLVVVVLLLLLLLTCPSFLHLGIHHGLRHM
jgi:hypothetical protein